MKAAVFEEPGNLRMKEIEKPDLSDGEVLLKTKYAAVCSTDIKIFTGQKKVDYLKPPIVLGHELVGEVVEVGKGHNKFSIGDFIIPYPGFACGECEYCLGGNHNLCPNRGALGYNYNGGFAEYVKIPAPIFDNARGRALKVPKGMSLKKAALFEPLSCSFNGLKQSRINEGDTALIVGLGFMGLTLLQLSRIFGATKVIGSDPIEERRKTAKQLGGDYVIDPTKDDYIDEIMYLTNDEGADAVVAAIGIPEVFESSLQLVKRGGSLNLFGGAPHRSTMAIDPNIIHYRQISLVGTSGYNLLYAHKVLNILETDTTQVENLVTGVYSFNQIEEAFESVAANKDIKALISFD